MSTLNKLSSLIIFISHLFCACILLCSLLLLFFLIIISSGSTCMLRIFVSLTLICGHSYSSHTIWILRNLWADAIRFLICQLILVFVWYSLIFLLFSFRIIWFFLQNFFFDFRFCSSTLLHRIIYFIVHFYCSSQMINLHSNFEVFHSVVWDLSFFRLTFFF